MHRPPVRIRPYAVADARALHEAARESIAHVYPWLAWCHPDIRLREAQQWLREQVANWRSGTAYEFAVLDGDGAFLGGCGVNGVDAARRTANLGYWLRARALGRGTAVEAVRLVADWTFANTDLVRLEIVCAKTNLRSRRVAERAGAVEQGVAKDRLEIHGVFHDAVIYLIRRDREGAAQSPTRR